MRAGIIVLVWMLISYGLGTVLGDGALVHGVWLAMLGVATLLSPAAIVGFRAITKSLEAGRLALAEADEDDPIPHHLEGPMREFFTATRLARLSLSDALEGGEGVRLLWEWRKAYEALANQHREQLASAGIGLGPVEQILGGRGEDNAALSPEQQVEATTHLGYVEQVLADAHQGVYR